MFRGGVMSSLSSSFSSSPSMRDLGRVGSQIAQKLENAFTPTFLEVVDESASHAGHREMHGKSVSESHFRVTIVSDEFSGKNLVARHRLVYAALAEEMKEGIHALALQTKTSSEMTSLPETSSSE